MDIRQAIYERDEYRCLECGLTDAEHRQLYGCALAIHRVVPDGGYTLENCITLCCVCHSYKAKGRNPPWLNPLTASVRLWPTNEELMRLDVVRKELQRRQGQPLSRQEALLAAVNYFIEHEGLFNGERQRQEALQRRAARQEACAAGVVPGEPLPTEDSGG